MNIVIPHLNHSTTQHLRYALRSIAKHHPDADVTIIGDCPVWARNVNHVPCTQPIDLRWKERNIYEKLLLAPYDNFVSMHDDHYLLKPVTKVKYMKQPGGYSGHYATTMRNTFEMTGEVDYDVHLPFWVDKSKMEPLASVDWNKPYGYGVQTLYCYFNDIKGKMIEDCKVKLPLRREEIFDTIKGRPAFSSGDTSFQGEMRSVLVTLFPEKCKFES